MKQLEELEKKILDIVKSNTDLHNKNELLLRENEKLKKKCGELEMTMLESNQASVSFESEKNEIKKTIEELLKNISSLEKADGKTTDQAS